MVGMPKSSRCLRGAEPCITMPDVMLPMLIVMPRVRMRMLSVLTMKLVIMMLGTMHLQWGF